MPIGNLRAIVNAAVQVVNPDVVATLLVSTGFAVVNHVQTPTYDRVSINAQVQAMSTKDLRQIDALNIQGAERVAYLNGSALAIDRVKALGGDLLEFPDGTLPEGNTWLIVASLEQWGNTWAKVAIRLQDDVTPP